MKYNPDYKYLPPITWHWLTPCYDFFCSLLGLGKTFKGKVLEQIDIKKGEVVVDVGCGTGVFLKLAVAKYPKAKFIGIDPDKEVLQIARKALSKVNVELKEGFAESLPFENDSVDICVSMLAFHHMPDSAKERACQEIYRVLKPGGKVYIADFGKNNNKFWRTLGLFEHLEYLEGNLNGIIMVYLKESGFKNIEVLKRFGWNVHLVSAKKS